MKVNLKKIGAIVAGATILASSVAFASLWYGNTQLVNDNGAPTVKVVVGASAAASDGVAAANIAAKVANEAYKSQTLSAQVSGEPSCELPEGEGECTVSDEKVTLEVTVPGSVAEGTYVLKTLIGDDIDRLLLDRDINSLSADGYNGVSDTSDSSGPFANGTVATALSSDAQTQIFRIDGGLFSPFKEATITDDVAGKTYLENQHMWVKGKTSYSDSADQIIAKLNHVAYSLKFKGATDDVGIPKCTTPTNSTLYASCTTSTNSDYLTATHRVNVKWLGEDWIVSEMNEPGTQNGVGQETTVKAGGSIKLAKESVSGILNQGESFDLGDTKLVLDDLEAHGETTSAIVSIVDANGNILKKDKATPGTTKEITAGGKTYRVHVYKVAPGYTFGAKWADMAVYSKEITFRDNQKLDPDYDNNKEWRVVVAWKNKGGDSSDATQVDSLRSVIVYTTDTQKLITDDFKKGDALSVVQDPTNWKLTYNGLTTVDYDDLSFKLERSSQKRLSGVRVTSTAEACNITVPFVVVTSSSSGSVFTMTGISSSGSSNKFYIATNGVGCDTSGSTSLKPGSILMPESADENNYAVRNYTVGAPSGTSTVQGIGDAMVLNVTYSLAGDSQSYANGGLISVMNATSQYFLQNTSFGVVPNVTAGTNPKTDFVFIISEKVGVGESYNNAGKFAFGFDNTTDTGSATFNFDEVSTPWAGTTYTPFSKDKIRYVFTGPVSGIANTTKEEGFYSERGSQYVSTDDETVKFKIAKELAYAQFTLAGSESATSSDTTTKVLAEGEEATIGGVKIKVKSIDQDVSSCQVGTGSKPVCDPASLTAALVDDKGTVVAEAGKSLDAAVPYKLTSQLVVLDKDAASTDVVVTVGGPVVNTVTAAALEGSAVDFTATPVVVKEVVAGKKVVVAGLTAEDTLQAAKDFLAALKKQ
ncbi:S-layer protein [Candidatus Micrarchaeota archaeon]|nr:S-layer protein [Candidatus Micrarchaeota archaeon]